MLVSWKWLQDYVPVNLSVEDLTDKLTMSGLNLEEFHAIGDDWCIDLEVTSNRPDCLGHLGIAREVAALTGATTKFPNPVPQEKGGAASSQVSVEIQTPELCPRYYARLIRGVKIGPSPAWLQERLKTVGIACINNVVDITNYVMLECAQPLHAFDFAKLRGGKIVVRQAKPGEKFKAINQKEYELTSDMCVIADAAQPVALAGVMGGFETEISSSTTDVLIEAASFAPLSVRATARKLSLHSPSSYRFERALDEFGPEWASRRCCQLILELAGGELQTGVVQAGTEPRLPSDPIPLRFGQFRRILGYDIPASQAISILQALGLKLVAPATAESASFLPPSYRRDLAREIDLVEEVARIYGYENMPTDSMVPLCVSKKTRRERVLDQVREVLLASGFFEALTLTFVSPEVHRVFQPRGSLAPLEVEHALRSGENLLRQSLVPSLLVCLRENERHGTFGARLFEVAKVYLESNSQQLERISEPTVISLASSLSYGELKGVLETLVQNVNASAKISVRPSAVSQFTPGRGAEVLLNGEFWGWLGELDRSATDRLDLREVATVAEVDLEMLEEVANLIPQSQPLPSFPSVTRDINLVLDEQVLWSDLAGTIQQTVGPLLDEVRFGGQYRGKQIADGKKSYLCTMVYRSDERTLTGEEIESMQQKILHACSNQHGAALRA